MKIGHGTEILKAEVSSVRWPIYITNSVDKTKFLYSTSPPTLQPQFLWKLPPFSLAFVSLLSFLFQIFPRRKRHFAEKKSSKRG